MPAASRVQKKIKRVQVAKAARAAGKPPRPAKLVLHSFPHTRVGRPPLVEDLVGAGL